MKAIKNIVITTAALLSMGTAVLAQNLADARKAITAEQYQKAKSILKNLTTTQADKDENFFYLGWIYIIQEYPDSARTNFNKGIAINPKSALNYAGLGAAARLDKDQATARTNFDKAMMFAGKDSKPYLYIGRAYLLPPLDFNNAEAVLQKGKAVNPKDAEISLALGDTYLTQLQAKGGAAFSSYMEAQTLDPKSPTSYVAQGIMVRYANNYDDSEADFKKAIALDPEFGPAYREWAETDLRWAQNEPKMASAKVKEALDHFQKFLSLTDMSVESRLRYMAFLLNAGDYKTLEQEAQTLSAVPNVNVRVYRYLAWSAYENKDYAAGLTAMQKFMSVADAKRVIPRDYIYLGRLQIATNSDSLGVQSLKKAYSLDSTQADVFKEIATSSYKKGKFLESSDAYRIYNERSRQATLNDHLSEGLSYYKAYTAQRSNKASKVPADTTLLRKADSVFTYVQHKAPSPNALVAYYQARANDFREPSTSTTQGLAKPYYEQYIALVTAREIKDGDKPLLSEAYDYLGRYYGYSKEKDEAKAIENYTKGLQYDPTDKEAQEFLARKGKK